MAIRARKISIATVAAAKRQNSVFNLLQQGKNRRYIMKQLRIPSGTLYSDIAFLRESVKAEHYFIPPRWAYKWGPAKVKKIIKFIELAKKVICGEAFIVHKKKGPWPGIPAEKHRKIIAMLKRNPLQTNVKIATAIGVNPHYVGTRRQILVARGKIPEISMGERFKLAKRMPWRKTGVLSKQQRQRVLEKNNEAIQKTARNLYHSNRKAFDFCNMLPESIADELRERLDWRLQTFNPAKISGPKEIKLQRFFDYSLHKNKLDVKRMAWRKFTQVASLEAAAEGKAPLLSYLKAPPEFKGITVAQLQEISSKLKLNLLEKAVLFGRAAGLTDKKIGNAIGCTESNVCRIKQRIESWVKTQLSK